ncbi:hypothetical protein GYMLUDRAFT_709133 [Collybiopsis luxurians FD-317 M1]|nr:hypothetical protein GYMLUDRAFT_709133 [Collybiopsis luxurians FD-317 M1]
MPVGSSSSSSSPSLTSTMAFNKASSLFKPKKSSKSPSPAASYLATLSQKASTADHATTIWSTSTPALSMSSSVSASTTDTIWTQADIENSHGLSFPVNPPTSEQVYTAVHTEFGHCSNPDYRRFSSHNPETTTPRHGNKEPPYYVLLSTYMTYLIMIIFGHIRDFLGKRFHPHAYKYLMPSDTLTPFSPDDSNVAWRNVSLNL